MHVRVMKMIRVRMMRMMRVRVSENDATVDCAVSRIFQEIKVLFFWRVFLLQIRSEILVLEARPKNIWSQSKVFIMSKRPLVEGVGEFVPQNV